MNTKVDMIRCKALKFCSDAIQELEGLLSKGSSLAYFSSENMNLCHLNMLNAHQKIIVNECDYDIDFFARMGRSIIDSWPKNTKLGNALLNAERYLVEYQNACRE